MISFKLNIKYYGQNIDNKVNSCLISNVENEVRFYLKIFVIRHLFKSIYIHLKMKMICHI